MAILKHFRAKSPAIVVHDREVICISDDDSSDSDNDSNEGDDGEGGENGNDSDDSNDEGEFEDVEVDAVANVEDTEARFEEAEDATNDETTVHGVSRDAQSDNGVTGGLPPKEGGAPETEDEGNATDIAPQDDAAGGDWDPHGDVDLGQDVSNASGLADVTCTSLRDIVVELDALRDRVAQLEAQQHVRSDCQAPSPSNKRHRTTSASPRAKRRKDSIVNISATRAFVQWDDTSGRCMYTWKRGRGGYCWVGGAEGGWRDEVDGGYLLCCATTMSVEIRANADWLPIEVQFNEEKQVFEGQASVGSLRLEVKDWVMMDMMCGGKGAHMALVQ